MLISKETDGKGGYQPGELTRNTTASLSKEQAELFLDQVQGTALWKLPTRQSGGIGLDGAQWIIEMAKSGRYRVIDRWSPFTEVPVHRLGITMMINLAHFKLLYQDVF